MSDPAPFDDVSFDEFRDLLDGRMDPAAQARLRTRLAADPALKAEFDTFAEVHAFTAAGTGSVPPTATTFEKLEAARRAQRIRRLRPWMATAAAAVLVVAAGAATWRHFHPARGTVVLQSISLTTAEAAPPVLPSSVPAELATYRPVVNGQVRWIDSLEKGGAIARFTNRPVFLWIHHPQCPVCVQWNQEAFRDREIQAKAGEFVPVRVNVMKAPRDVQALAEKGWPYLGVMDSDLHEVAEFAGEQTTEVMRGHLDAALGTQAKLGPPVAWDLVNELAAALARGAKSVEVGDFATACAEFAKVRDRAPEGALRSAAIRGLLDVMHAAAARLTDARKLAESEDEAERQTGARRLSEAAERFRGTPYGTDLAEVEQELRATGCFPVLVEETAGKRNDK